MFSEATDSRVSTTWPWLWTHWITTSRRRCGVTSVTFWECSDVLGISWDWFRYVQMADPQLSSTDIPCCSPFEIWNALFIEIPTETFRCILFVPCVDFFHKTGIPGSYWPLDPMRYTSSQELQLDQLGCCWNVVEMLYFLNCQQMVWNPGVTPSSCFTVTNLSWKRLGV